MVLDVKSVFALQECCEFGEHVSKACVITAFILFATL